MKSKLLLVALSFFISNFSFAQQARPNIILVIGDDMRYDSFLDSVSFFHTPSINRIAYEGVNFKNSFCVYSLCVPSRASIMTGLYPHSHGATDNFSHIIKTLPTIAKILDTLGYHNAMIGKYDVEIKQQPGWEYWMVTLGHTDYVNPIFQYFNTRIGILGNTTQILTDTSLAYIAKADTPFFVCIGHQVPHKTIIPEPQYDGYYASETMPVPSTFHKFGAWYPSFLYEKHDYYTDTARLSNDYENYFEGLLGLEDNVTGIFNVLTTRGILDNTMIIFISDNGSLYGEHLLAGKGLAYDPSMRVPLFIRFPQWFADSTVSSELALNVDLAPTIVKAAGKDPAEYHFEGMLLKDLGNGITHRDKMEFENIKIDHPGVMGDTAPTPSLRALRTLHYKFARYHCNQTTEEFFNLDTDADETSNLIHDPHYTATIAGMRASLDSMMVVLDDTLEQTIDTVFRPCKLVKAGKQIFIHGDTLVFKLGPNPSSDLLNINILSRSGDDILLTMLNELGEVMLRKTIPTSGGFVMSEVDVKQLPAGMYYVEAQQGDLVTVHTLLKE